jgi:hypothetical protein
MAYLPQYPRSESAYSDVSYVSSKSPCKFSSHIHHPRIQPMELSYGDERESIHDLGPLSLSFASYHRSMTCGTITAENPLKVLTPTPLDDHKSAIDSQGYLEVPNVFDGCLERDNSSSSKIRAFLNHGDVELNTNNRTIQRISTSLERNHLLLVVSSYLNNLSYTSAKHYPVHMYWLVHVTNNQATLRSKVFIVDRPDDSNSSSNGIDSLAVLGQVVEVWYEEGDIDEYVRLTDGLRAVLSAGSNTGAGSDVSKTYESIAPEEDEYNFLGLTDSSRVDNYYIRSITTLTNYISPNGSVNIRDLEQYRIAEQERYQAIRNLFDGMQDQSYIPRLIELGAVGACLNVFQNSNNGGMEVKGTPSYVKYFGHLHNKIASLEHPYLKVYAVQCLSCLYMADKKCLVEIANHGVFLNYLKNITVNTNDNPFIHVVEICKRMKISLYTLLSSTSEREKLSEASIQFLMQMTGQSFDALGNTTITMTGSVTGSNEEIPMGAPLTRKLSSKEGSLRLAGLKRRLAQQQQQQQASNS